MKTVTCSSLKVARCHQQHRQTMRRTQSHRQSHTQSTCQRCPPSRHRLMDKQQTWYGHH